MTNVQLLSNLFLWVPTCWLHVGEDLPLRFKKVGSVFPALARQLFLSINLINCNYFFFFYSLAWLYLHISQVHISCHICTPLGGIGWSVRMRSAAPSTSPSCFSFSFLIDVSFLLTLSGAACAYPWLAVTLIPDLGWLGGHATPPCKTQNSAMTPIQFCWGPNYANNSFSAFTSSEPAAYGG